MLAAVLLAASMTGCFLLEDDVWEEESSREGLSSHGGATAQHSAQSPTIRNDDAVEGVASEELQYGAGYQEAQWEEAFDPNKVAKITRSARPIRQIQKQDIYGRVLSEGFYFHRSGLSRAEQALYDQLYANALEADPYFEVSAQVPKERMNAVFAAVQFDNPDLFWLDVTYSFSYDRNGNVSSVTLTFFDCVNQLDAYKQTFYSYTDSVLEAVRDFDDIDKIKYIHDLLININNYSFGYMNQSAYSAVCYGETVCMGYAAAFQYYMQRLGIPSAIVNGDAGENHVWNIVYLDGDFYSIDVTWDDPVGNPANTYYYDYFNITDGEISRSHARLAPGTALPAANGTYYTYGNYYGSQPGSDFSALNYGRPSTILPPIYPGEGAAYAPQTPQDDEDDWDDAGQSWDDANDDFSDGFDDGEGDFDEAYYEFYDWTDEEWDAFWDLLEQELDDETLAYVAEMDWDEFFALMVEICEE